MFDYRTYTGIPMSLVGNMAMCRGILVLLLGYCIFSSGTT